MQIESKDSGNHATQNLQVIMTYLSSEGRRSSFHFPIGKPARQCTAILHNNAIIGASPVSRFDRRSHGFDCRACVAQSHLSQCWVIDADDNQA